MASSSKGQQKKGKSQGSTLPIINTGGDHVEEETAVPFSVTQALQNDLVLDNVFSYLSVTDLKTCRQICQHWKQATRRSLVEKCNPVRFVGKSMLLYEEAHGIGEMVKLTSVISTSNGSGSEFPVTKFLVGADILTALTKGQEQMDMDSREEILRDFFQAMGPFATELAIGFLDNAKLFQSDAPLNIEFLRLKTLKLKLRFVASTDFLSVENLIRSNLAFYQNILENAPQLSTLDIHAAGPETMDLLINLMERIVLARKISTIYLTTTFRDDHFDRLAGIGLKLTSLRLLLLFHSSYGLQEVGEGWMKFLESQSDTLEELCVECDGWRIGVQILVGFPILPKLKSLTLQSYCDGYIRFSGMVYAKQFPVLEQLSLAGNSKSSLETLLNYDIPPVPTVETLKLPKYLNDPVWIWHAARIFPNVKKLKIPGMLGIVEAVFQAWQNVEELTIDVWSGGAPANKLLTANFKGHLPSNYRSKTYEPIGEPDKFLQDLKILRLQGFHRSAAPTSRICHFVFLKMGSLKCLDLSQCMNPRISTDMLRKMRKQFVVLCQEKKDVSRK